MAFHDNDPHNIAAFLPFIRSILWKRGYAMPRLLDPEDFIQEAYLALHLYWQQHKNLNTIAPPHSKIIESGMIEAFRRIGLSRRRTGLRKLPEPLTMVPLETVMEILADPGALVETQVHDARVQEAIWSCVKQLPSKEAMVLIAMFLQGVTQRELGWRLHLTEGRISQIKSSGVRHLWQPLSMEKGKLTRRRPPPEERSAVSGTRVGGVGNEASLKTPRLVRA